MGNRVKGRTKKKSVKAAISSSAGSKRKLSRMGKKLKRDNAGVEATFIGRSRCLKLLQLPLKDFRRLCILKGIYPREPTNRAPSNKKGQTFYHIKDIRAIAHEPILEKFRDFQAFMKKVRRAAGRNEVEEANRKNSLLPTYTLNHLVKERYPRFTDALGDIDDALTLVYLFAALPGEGEIKPQVTNKAKTLAAAWGAYCATTSVITKSFISVKGVYLEASIHGQPIRWVIPHSFTQYLPEDIDYRVMMTFFEFYETLLSFVLFKLYSDIGIRYPFTVKDLGDEVKGSTSSILAVNIRALKNAFGSSGSISNVVSQSIDDGNANLTKVVKKKASKELVKSVGVALNKLVGEDSDAEEEEDAVDVSGPLKAALDNMAEEQSRNEMLGTSKLDDDAITRRGLFQGLTFFLSREVPRGYLEVVILAFGGQVGWENDDSPFSMKDASITHHIVDRPRLPNDYKDLPKSREYIQPQWVLDSANFSFLLPISRYAVGSTLPPHLSPWVDDEEEGYKPAYAEEIERMKNGETIDDEEGIPDATGDEMVEMEELDKGPEEEKMVTENESSESEDDDEEDEKIQKRMERKRKKEEEETHELAKSMMNKKAAHLYGRMQHGISKKQEKIDTLKQRRKDYELSKKDEAGRTTQKQRVDRLRGERKELEKAYTDTGGTMKRSRKSKK